VAAEFVPPVWKCDNDKSMKPTTRHLFEEEEDHDHDDHDHSHHHEHDHSTTDGIDLTDIKNELRNSNSVLGSVVSFKPPRGTSFKLICTSKLILTFVPSMGSHAPMVLDRRR
jgi:hypothetical protein